MSENDRASSNLQRLWEALFSLHLALTGVSMALDASERLAVPFAHLEIRINRLLHIRQTDFIRGYFECWIPTVLAALLIWTLLRTFARTRAAGEFLRSLAGMITIFAPLAFWVFVYMHADWSFVWPYQGAPFEMAIALACAYLFLSGKWKAPLWAIVVLLAAHSVFWYYVPGSDPSGPNYVGPAGPILGFCAATAWGLYVSQLRKAKTVGTPDIS